ncbi:MAG: hypothetical protein JRI35_04955 [Deltaproteobacteria bacterium]|nr:hypothetical protein [Deltaproteobacteria bacterium]MBW1946402.1 hypothetical protein [Deltaproteobacteria bacterium]
MNPLYPALERLLFSGFQSSLIVDRRGSAIRPAVETLQKANRSCGRARMATLEHNGHNRSQGSFFWKRFALAL